MGFGAQVRPKKDRHVGDLLRMVQPEDLLKYGLIPEFVGRLPVIATLEELDERTLIRVLTEPRNALIKQYEKLFAFEKVKLKFTDNAVAAIAQKAHGQKTGARGLRAILEEVMLDLMYELPSQKNVKEVIINEDAIHQTGQPILLYENDKDVKSA
jgi:ATP-dependent Clp protease ATP-binding subunit ClpX